MSGLGDNHMGWDSIDYSAMSKELGIVGWLLLLLWVSDSVPLSFGLTLLIIVAYHYFMD